LWANSSIYHNNVFYGRLNAFFFGWFCGNPKAISLKKILRERHMEESKLQSKFEGGVLPIFLFSLWAPLLLGITLSLAFPFVICTVIRWICNNAVIGGKRYRFNGTAGGLFGRWIIWFLLSIITLGIYSFWSTRNQIRWVVENLEVVD
jgi:uncharacterized membrane protein YjgN (DUF898 family)